MKKILLILTVMVILSYSLPVMADNPQGLVLSGGYVATVIRYTKDGRPVYQADLATPKYLDDLITPIDTSWKSNGNGFSSGANKFYATVADEAVTVMDKDSQRIGWTPKLKLANDVKAQKAKGTVINDPMDNAYKSNTIMWDYGNGIKRYLRAIEGVLQEYYQITTPLTNDLTITNKAVKDKDYKADRKAIAYDSKRNAIRLTTDDEHNITVSTKDLVGVQYPIIIDPDNTFYSMSDDGYTGRFESAFATVRTAATSEQDFNGVHYENVYDTDVTAVILSGYHGTSSPGQEYRISRASLIFDTSSLGEYTVTAATLSIYPQQTVENANSYSVQVQSGMPLYPHLPIIATDYNYLNYSGSYGTKTLASMTSGTFNTITLDTSVINEDGYTKLTLRMTGDINNDTPTGINRVIFYTYEAGISYRPKMVVTFTAENAGITANSASNVAITGARLNSTVTTTGGDTNVEVRFGYGNDSKAAGAFDTYDTVGSWVDGYIANDKPYLDVASLSSGTQYYYRVQVRNSVGTVTSTDEITFTTESAVSPAPTAVPLFYGIPSSTSVALSWVRPTGASRVLIRYSFDVLPALTTDGTQLYLGSNGNYTHTGLASGKTVYYALWGEDSGTYSADPLTLVVTTSLGAPASDMNLAYGNPTGWNQEPDQTGLAQLEPIYSLVNNFADSWGMPRGNFWFMGYTLITTALALLIYLKWNNAFGAMAVLTVLWIIGMYWGLLPTQMIILEALMMAGVWVFRRESASV